MRKRVFGKKLSRGHKSRKALYRSLVRALVVNGSIVTTGAKAKVMRREVDKIMILIKDGSLAARRRVLAKLGNDRATTDELFGTYGVLTKTRSSGFTKRTLLLPRKGDNAEMARVEWVEKPVKEEEKKVKGKKTKEEQKKTK